MIDVYGHSHPHLHSPCPRWTQCAESSSTRAGTNSNRLPPRPVDGVAHHVPQKGVAPLKWLAPARRGEAGHGEAGRVAASSDMDSQPFFAVGQRLLLCPEDAAGRRTASRL